MRIDLELKNYRCFSDSQPVRFAIDKDVVALIGPNNSGKSSLLRFFVEFRQQFAALSTYNDLWNHLAGVRGGRGSQLFVDDASEIFCDRNARDLSIALDLRTAASGSAIRAEFVLDRENLGMWTSRFYAGKGRVDLNTGYQPSMSGIEGDGTLRLRDGSAAVNFSELRDAFRVIGNVFYVGPFRNAINVGQGDYYDLHVGTKFIDTWEEWQTGADKTKQRAVASAVEDIRHIFGFSQLSITAAKKLNTLQLTVNGRPYKLREVGAGLHQFIVVFGNAIIQRPRIILIDEPETNLHPSLQLDFLTSLASYASHGLVFATHSIGLARSAADRIYSIHREGEASVLGLFEKSAAITQFLGEMSFSSIQELPGASILLVEGATDIRTFQQFLRKYRKDHNYVPIHLGGDGLAKGDTEYELRELKRITDRVFAIVDSERSAVGADPKPERTEFARVCEKVGIKVLLTERRSTENYFTDESVKAVLGSKYSALGPYSELREASIRWGKHDNWRIAREMRREDLDKTDLGAFLASL
jgi:ABC-type cobalamin/Fe3+-siderophores transport system ATPase subunit